MTNVSAVMAELMEKVEVNSPRMASMHYCLSEASKRIAELEQKLAESEVRCEALAAENAQMLRLLTDISENHDEYVNQDEYLYAGIPMDYVSEINSYVSRDVEAENPFKATDAFLAEVRAQAKADGVQEYADSFRHSASKIRECHGDTIRVRALLHEANNADDFAAQLRKGVQ